MSKPPIDLFKGYPNPSLLPVAQIKAAAHAALSDPLISTPGLLYGPDPGYQPLRTQIARWLSEFYQASESIDPERICITGGASQSAACLLQAFSDQAYTRIVWMVSPTYFHACRIFDDGGLTGRLRAVPEDEEGLDIAFLTRALEEDEAIALKEDNARPTSRFPRPEQKFFRYLIYAVPTFANPSSAVMSESRREQLVRLARKHDALIITDDVYDQLQWPIADSARQLPLKHAHKPRLVDIDRSLDGGAERPGADGFGNAVSNGSFSKIVGPGCRSGWIEGTKKFAWGLSQIGSTKSGGAPSQLTSTYMHLLLKSGELQQHIFHVLQPAYRRRYRIMMTAINKYLAPLAVTVRQPHDGVFGGYFIWLTLPNPLTAERVCEYAKKKHDLDVKPGSIFAVWNDENAVDLDSNIRLAFSWAEEKDLVEGIVRLAFVVRQLQAESSE